MKTLYAIPNYECVLSCDYCDIKDKKDEYLKNKFIDQLYDFNGHIILFGGEPLLYHDRFKTAMETAKIDSISTTLLFFGNNTKEERENYALLKKYHPSITTTYGVNRFKTASDYEYWLDNINRLSVIYELDISVIVTLTKEILNIQPVEFTSIIKEWRSNKIRFEFLILPREVNDNGIYKKADDWLIQVHDLWPDGKENILDSQLTHWYFDCSEVYTLTPSGNIINKCPHSFPKTICEECLSCEYNVNCRPCILQSRCVFPRNYYQKVAVENENAKENTL